MYNFHLAIDIGASGGRHILGFEKDGEIHLEEIHRFPNEMKKNEHSQLVWDLDFIWNEIIIGLKKCKTIGKIPKSVGIDTWGVDFVLVDKYGNPTCPTVAYRDNRTDGMDDEVSKYVSETELYNKTGIQKMMFNTIYQLMAIKIKTPQYFADATRLLMIPDYLHYKLCGKIANEYTIASTTGLLNIHTKTWDEKIISRCGFPQEIFSEITPAGTMLGEITEEIQKTIGFSTTVILPPSHDTASAVVAVPAKTLNNIYISSGTWSLVGVTLDKPSNTKESRLLGFTNEGGYKQKIRFLKNIAGMWLLQNVKKEINNSIDYAELLENARNSNCNSIFNVNDSRLTAPKSMITTISELCRENDMPIPQTIGDFARSIFFSLATTYSETKNDLEKLTGLKYDSINIIGGGCQNEFLNELTSQKCGVPVFAGPVEGTAIGNIKSQALAYCIYDLVKISNRYGADVNYTIKAAGNTSFKDENILYVKASGTSLATVTADDFVALNMVSLLDILNLTNINELLKEENTQSASVEIFTEKQDEPSHNILNKNILEAMLSARISQKNSKRPSIESILHAMFPYKYVLHLHPVIVNALTCSKNGENVCKKLFNDKAIWIKAVPPGPELAILCNEALTEYEKKTGSFPQIVFMQNHGVFVTANTVNEIDELMEYVTNTIKNEIKDFTLITAPEKPLTPDQVLDSSDKSVLENAAKIASFAESFGGVLPLTDDIIGIIKLVYG